MQHTTNVMIVVILLLVSIETNNALTAKSYVIEANKAGTILLDDPKKWKFMKSQGVSFSECSVSKTVLQVRLFINKYIKFKILWR